MKECEDAISRADAIRIAEQGQVHGFPWEFEKLTLLPSVYPKAKVGKWVTWSEENKCDGYTEYRTRCKCSECNTEYDGYFTHFIKYCSNCGAKMEGVQEGNKVDISELENPFNDSRFGG